jgi:hypothetical protein
MLDRLETFKEWLILAGIVYSLMFIGWKFLGFLLWLGGRL